MQQKSPPTQRIHTVTHNELLHRQLAKKRRQQRRRRLMFRRVCALSAFILVFLLLILIVTALTSFVSNANKDRETSHSSNYSGVGRATAPPTPEVQYIVALDPGHGGVDDGAVGYCTEQDITKMVIYRLQQLLEEDGRFIVIITKDDDSTASVQDRVDVVNSAGAQLLISVHCNSDSKHENSSGFECYAVPPAWSTNAESVRFAKEIVTVIQETFDIRIRGANGIRYIYFNNGNRQVAEYGDDKKYGANTFGLLQRSNCPGVMIEQFFVTNYSDASTYGSEWGCYALAECYYTAICNYFDSLPS